jgi:hypothetical protein
MSKQRRIISWGKSTTFCLLGNPKKSLRAAEQERADVARARRR